MANREQKGNKEKKKPKKKKESKSPAAVRSTTPKS